MKLVIYSGGVHGNEGTIHAVWRGVCAVLLRDGPAVVPRGRRVQAAAGASEALRETAACARRE